MSKVRAQYPTYPWLREVPVEEGALKAGQRVDGEPGGARPGRPVGAEGAVRPAAGHGEARRHGVAGVGVAESANLVAGHGLREGPGGPVVVLHA